MRHLPCCALASLAISCRAQSTPTSLESERMIRICIEHNGGEQACRKKYAGRGSASPNGDAEMVRVCIEHNGGAEACRKKYGGQMRTGSTQEYGGTIASEPAAGTTEYKAVATLYTTENNSREGGAIDRCGKRLGTLEDFLAGKTSSVSVAMDSRIFPYGTTLRIPQLDAKFNGGRPIPFQVVDTGSAFEGRGASRMDICVGDSQADVDACTFTWMSKRELSYSVVTRGAGQAGSCPD